MKDPKTVKGLLGKLSKGTLVNANQVRNVFKKAEVNVLELTSQELKSLNSIIDADLKSASKNTRASAGSLQKFVSRGSSSEDGSGYLLPPSKYTQMAKIGKILGKTDENNYHLGHSDIGNLAQTLGLILEEYKKGGHNLTGEQASTIRSGILAAQKLDRMDEETLKHLVEVQDKNSDVLIRALSGSTKGLETDLIATIDFARNVRKGDISMRYTFEDKATNKAKGDLSKILSSKIRKYVKDISKKDGDALAGRLDSLFEQIDNPFGLRASPSFSDYGEEFLDSVSKGKNTPNKRISTKVQLKKTIPAASRAEAKKIASIIKLQTKNLLTKISAVKRKKRFLIPTVTLKAIINKALQEAIQADMEHSSAPSSRNYLRYQSGDFSESAKILTLNRQQTGAYTGTYTYAKDPYSVFEPGRRLGTPGRNPKRYIEGAARRIAFQVLKKNFIGLTLET